MLSFINAQIRSRLGGVHSAKSLKSAGIIAGAQAGKNAVENNTLGDGFKLGGGQEDIFRPEHV
ncbi:VENN motif pre-toxin domain-containing protein [Salmonella enterica subsp. salamae]|nr:VENN motif pre-toxin domain-containing protein [Salmonella enterica subsp. salamae]